MARSDRPHRTALKAAGPAAAAAVVWGPEQLAQGGLAPVVVATMTAVLVAAPLSARLWGLAKESSSAVSALRMSGRLCLSLVTAGAMAQVMPHTTTGTLLGAGLLCLGVAVSQVRAGIALPVATIAAIAAITQGNPTPWTLLDPVWTTWQQWLALSVGTGFLLGSAGFGGWAEGRPAIPGWRRGPWVTVGLGTLLFAMGVTAWAQQFEVGDLATTPLPALLAIVVATGWGDREELPTWSGVFGLLAVYLWLCSPLAPNMALFWTLTLLLPPVLGACLLAYQARGAVRVQMAGTAVLGLGALGLGWPGFGASATAAAMAMLPLLLVLWTGGTHVALRRSA